jgi:hypothetical protein
MSRQVFLDLDGVLADFDSFYAQHFGVQINRNMPEDPPGLWENIRSHGTFYRDLPILPDALDLWHGVKHLNPTILTGVPYHQVPTAAVQKRTWVRWHFGVEVPIICCRSRDKWTYGQPGDVLVDDWVRYRHLWEEMGGVFVLHTSTAATLERLKVLGVL